MAKAIKPLQAESGRWITLMDDRLMDFKMKVRLYIYGLLVLGEAFLDWIMSPLSLMNSTSNSVWLTRMLTKPFKIPRAQSSPPQGGSSDFPPIIISHDNRIPAPDKTSSVFLDCCKPR